MELALTSLRVVNCGPLRDVRIDFTDAEKGEPLPVVLLYGPNGSGKTTILEIIAILAEDLFTNYEPDTILVRAEYAQLDMLVDNELVSFYNGICPKDAIIAKTWLGRYISSEIGMEEPSNSGDFLEKFQPIRRKTGSLRIRDSRVESNDSVSDVPSVLYFSYSRFISKVEGRTVEKEDTEYQWVYRYQNRPEYSGSLNSYLIWLDYAEPEQFIAAQAFLNGLYPDKKRFEVERRRLKAVVLTQDGNKHDLDLLSSGEQNLLIVLLELRRRLTPHSIVLIDEIENSLHEAFQYRMAQGLLKLQEEIPFQLIATSHSGVFAEVFGTKAVRVLPMVPYAAK